MQSIRVVSFLIAFSFFIAAPAYAGCANFVGSTMVKDKLPLATWRTDYPNSAEGTLKPWLSHDFATDPKGYLGAVMSTASGSFARSNNTLRGNGSERWWISEWMDYDRAGREPHMGLTKERGPKKGDLSPTSVQGPQVWAVGFYNALGAVTLGQIFKDPCLPEVPDKVLFEEGTVAIKFLFTDANHGDYAGQVSYLDGGPLYTALIDEAGSSSSLKDPADRTDRSVQLLQMDIAVKDNRASKTGWVFGTFVWMGPTTGDGLFDNLVPTSLQWANDEGNYTDQMTESWVNPDLEGKLFGFGQRYALGFRGRANGPADNIRSSCLSCHAAARSPDSNDGLLGHTFDLNKWNDIAAVKAQVDKWFRDLKPGEMFDPANPPGAAALDYSLQLAVGFERICQACEDGALKGDTPPICKAAGFYNANSCATKTMSEMLASQADRADEALLKRQ